MTASGSWRPTSPGGIHLAGQPVLELDGDEATVAADLRVRRPEDPRPAHRVLRRRVGPHRRGVALPHAPVHVPVGRRAVRPALNAPKGATLVKYVKLGRTGLDVSRICLGCMSYGDASRGLAPLGARRGRVTSVLPPGVGCRDQLLRHRQRLLGGHQRGVPRARAGRPRRAPRRAGDRDQGERADAQGTEQHRAVAQGDPRRGRPQPAPARHRLHRPVPDPPPRSTSADGGDARSVARRGEGGEGPVPRRVVDVGVGVRQGAAPRRDPRLDEVRQHAEPLQPPQPRGGARDAAPVRRPGRRRDPVEPARPRSSGPSVGRDHRAIGERRLRLGALRGSHRSADRRTGRRGRR